MNFPKLSRYEHNPIVSPIRNKDHWWEARSVFNPGAIVKDGKIYLLYRALGEVYYSNFGLAILSDPTAIEKRFDRPVFEPEDGNKFEQFGVEDPRITHLDGKYYIVYNAPSIYRGPSKAEVPEWQNMAVPWRLRCSLAETEDFMSFKRHGVILPDIDSKDGVLFPEKINGQYGLLHRIYPDMWISFSDTITHFEKGQVLCSVREGEWDSERIGAGATPIKTELGWLLFYHGVANQNSLQNHSYHDRGLNGNNFQYSLGIMLLDLHDPRKILYRSEEPILVPETEYERKGYVNNVVFSCGAIEWKNMYYIYYGACDTRVAVASVGKHELLGYLKFLI